MIITLWLLMRSLLLFGEEICDLPVTFEESIVQWAAQHGFRQLWDKARKDVEKPTIYVLESLPEGSHPILQDIDISLVQNRRYDSLGGKHAVAMTGLLKSLAPYARIKLMGVSSRYPKFVNHQILEQMRRQEKDMLKIFEYDKAYLNPERLSDYSEKIAKHKYNLNEFEMAETLHHASEGRIENRRELQVLQVLKMAKSGGADMIVTAELWEGPGNGAVADAIRNLAKEGIPVVAAAGNDGPDNIEYLPSTIREVITVGSANERGTDVATLSSRGRPGSGKPDLLGPGGWIPVPIADGEFGCAEGTSPQAYIVAAALLNILPILKKEFSKLHQPNSAFVPYLKEKLCRASKDLGAPREAQGCGVFNPESFADLVP